MASAITAGEFEMAAVELPESDYADQVGKRPQQRVGRLARMLRRTCRRTCPFASDSGLLRRLRVVVTLAPSVAAAMLTTVLYGALSSGELDYNPALP